MPKGKGALYYAIARPVGMQVVSCTLGDCHSSAVAVYFQWWKGVLKGFLPGSNPCGGCKNIRLSLACIPMALLKPYEVFLGPVGPWAFLWPFTLGAPARLPTRCVARKGFAL